MARFDAERGAVDGRLVEICETYLSTLPSNVADAITYALTGPGKRLRPLLVLLSYQACGGRQDATLLACGPEVIHAYSLMHDDLPCMDDDDMRRGRPAAHKLHGIRTSMIAGVVMIPLAGQVVRDASRQLALAPGRMEQIHETLLRAAGSGGMIGGQLRDLAGEGVPLSLEEREAMHVAKTGALIVASLEIGGLAAGADGSQIEALRRFGQAIGLAFQIMDDILDVTSTTTALGKTAGRDVALGKSTYPALLGVEGARLRAQALMDDGKRGLAEHDLLTQELSQVANFMVTRTS